MAQAKTFTVDHQCDKADISPLASLIGKFNSQPYSIDGVEHAAGSLAFRGFVGKLHKATGKYVGVLRFEQQHAGEEFDGTDFNEFHDGPRAPLDDGTAQGDDD